MLVEGEGLFGGEGELFVVESGLVGGVLGFVGELVLFEVEGKLTFLELGLPLVQVQLFRTQL